MRQLFAVLGDSLREALDRKLFVVLLLLTSLPILLCLSISFEREPVEVTLKHLAGRLNRFRVHHPRHFRRLNGLEAAVTIGEVRAVDSADGWPAELRGGHVVDLSFSEPTQLDALVHAELHDPDTMPAPCSACDNNEHCWGCRASAYNYHGDANGLDPKCWIVAEYLQRND